MLIFRSYSPYTKNLFLDELDQERQDDVLMCAMDHFDLFSIIA